MFFFWYIFFLIRWRFFFKGWYSVLVYKVQCLAYSIWYLLVNAAWYKSDTHKKRKYTIFIFFLILQLFQCIFSSGCSSRGKNPRRSRKLLCWYSWWKVIAKKQTIVYALIQYFKRHEATAEIWQETYLSAVLRSILYSDDNYYRLAGYRKVDPIMNLASEKKFLEAVESLF